MRYLDDLDGITDPLPVERRLLGALGPRMVALAGSRAAGAHPYVVTPAHTRWARGMLGGAVLAPEQTVVAESDPVRARAVAREFLRTYLALPNYTRNWLRSAGMTAADLAGGGTDRLVDAVVAHGSTKAIAAAVAAHWAAGADHVCLQVLGGAAARDQALPGLAHALAAAAA